MANLSTQYLGLDLKNPVVVASSGLTQSVENIKKIEAAGAGAVVLKSLFEEQIRHEVEKTMKDDSLNVYPEAYDYISEYSHANRVDEYLNLIRQAKKEVSIPVIASINCVSSEKWTSFAKKIEEAGADALELNVFMLPADPMKDGIEYEKLYFSLLEEIQKQVSLPVALKIGGYFSGLAKTAVKLSWAGAKGLVLFNRFFSPDIDINTFTVKAGNVYSQPAENSNTLRWIAMLSDKVYCDLAASTGIHDGEAVIKQLLAGAKVVQIASVLYKKGFEVIPEILNTLQLWMDKNNFATVDDFRGKMSFKKAENPAAFERVQFMKHFAGIE